MWKQNGRRKRSRPDAPTRRKSLIAWTFESTSTIPNKPRPGSQPWSLPPGHRLSFPASTGVWKVQVSQRRWTQVWRRDKHAPACTCQLAGRHVPCPKPAFIVGWGNVVNPCQVPFYFIFRFILFYFTYLVYLYLFQLQASSSQTSWGQVETNPE